MKLNSCHADGSAHRVWEAAVNTVDPWAFLIPAHSQVREASGSAWSSPYPVVGLFWPQRFYQVFLLLKETATDYYCNVITPPVYRPETNAIEFIDLDLDVLSIGRKVWVADEEEFAARSPSYPKEWVTEANTAKDVLWQYVQAGSGPFSLRTAEVWRQRILGCANINPY